MDTEHVTTIRRFLRGDMAVRDFEAWFYEHESALLPHFGEELHYDMLWLNFSDYPSLYMILPRLQALVGPTEAPESGVRCECEMLADRASFPMGFDGRDARFHETVKEVKAHSKALWWLWLGQCNCCGEYWMVASEQVIFDLYMVNRMTAEAAQHIITSSIWPEEFLSYERLLRLCKTRAGADAFMRGDSWGAQTTTRRLKAERPDIANEDIAWLLGVTSEDIAKILADDAEAAAAAERERNPPKKSWWQRLIDP